MIVPPWAVRSPMRAAALLPTTTVVEPPTIELGGPSAHTQAAPWVAAAKLPINTVGTPGAWIDPPTWGKGDAAGQMWGSSTRAAGRVIRALYRVCGGPATNGTPFEKAAPRTT